MREFPPPPLGGEVQFTNTFNYHQFKNFRFVHSIYKPSYFSEIWILLPDRTWYVPLFCLVVLLATQHLLAYYCGTLHHNLYVLIKLVYFYP